jgi:predicted RNA methylase
MGTKGTTKSQGQKHALDKFYTKSHVAKACLELLDLGAYDLIIEPSAGGGAFSDPLFAGPSPNVLAFDLDPENPGVHQQDWFEYTTRGPAATLVVGNPPFGQQCSLALAFINHAFETVGAQTVAFILPRSFRKPSVQSRVFKHARHHTSNQVRGRPSSAAAALGCGAALRPTTQGHALVHRCLAAPAVTSRPVSSHRHPEPVCLRGLPTYLPPPATPLSRPL